MPIPKHLRIQRSIEKLFAEHRSGLSHYPWESEDERQHEFVACLLIAGLEVDPAQARACVHVLDGLSLLSPHELAALREKDRQFIRQALARAGLPPKLVGRVTVLLEAAAQIIRERWRGHLQRFLREHGDQMVEELAEELVKTRLKEPARRKVAALWLQNVANLPILLPEDEHIAAFCSRHEGTESDLLEAADQLGLNLALVDDLLAMDEKNAREGEEVTPSVNYSGVEVQE